MGVRNMIAPRGLKGTWALALVVGTLSLQAHADNADSPLEISPSQASARSSDGDGYECATEEAEAQPRNATEWLERGLWASHCYAFQARAVAIDSVDVRTLALSHRIKDGIRQQVVQYLDGPSVSIERRSPVGRLAWTEGHSNGELPSPARWAAHLEKYYAIELEDNTRVADRDAVKLIFEPRDQWRFSHEWWLDGDTGLLLKHVLSDHQGRIIETFQITQLQSPEKYTGSVRATTPIVIGNTPWRATWLPDGFVAQPVTFAGDDMHQRVYSDGLATVSIFVEPLASEATTTLQEGVQQLGVSAVAVEHAMTAEGRWQLVAIGELPVATLQRIVRSITFDLLEDQSPQSTDQAGQME
ncbi:MucB/RseB C-terminal domain-containing protein [Halomonas sp. SpR1]|uniref:MucB/RseB C-terminal domain-containing protein n=1 Tax=Halomonas sp. SpR1 TaxID=3050462 RepID=UPI0027E46314|nr:MucB/RseB C-terminal domain-containing protein [Halomonas sp. SpR1]MDQ7731578.1 MucB/RseB C-terminal domain-containing protein [Halomonas sp. SpR1]